MGFSLDYFLSPIAIIGFVSIGLILSLILGHTLRNWFGMPPWTCRVCIHVLVGLFSTFSSLLATKRADFVIVGVSFALVNLLSIKYDIIKGMQTNTSPSLGTVFFPISFSILGYLFYNNMTIFVITFLILTLSDPLGSIVGRWTQKKLHKDKSKPYRFRYVVFKDAKTLFGSLTVFFSSIVVAVSAMTFIPYYMQKIDIILRIPPEDLDSFWCKLGSLLNLTLTPLHKYMALPFPHALLFAVLIAPMAMCLESMSIYGSDNLSLPLGLCVFIEITSALGPIPVLFWEVVTALVCIVAYFSKAVTIGGAMCAFVVGTLIFAPLSTPSFLLVAIFLISGSLLTRRRKLKESMMVRCDDSTSNIKRVIQISDQSHSNIKKPTNHSNRAHRDDSNQSEKRKSNKKQQNNKKKGRDAWQVICNLSAGGCISIGLFISNHSLQYCLYPLITCISAATADTWASEFGRIFAFMPHSPFSMKTKLPVGRSGGISFIGSIFGLLGSTCISIIGIVSGQYTAVSDSCDFLSAFAIACNTSLSESVILSVYNDTDYPLTFSNVDANLVCIGAQYRFVVELFTSVEFYNDAKLYNFELAGDGVNDIIFYGETSFLDLIIRDAKLKTAKTSEPTVFTNVTISSSSVRVSYPSLIPYNVSLFDDTSLVIVGSLLMSEGTLLSAVPASSDGELQNISILVKGDVEFPMELDIGPPGQILMKNILNSGGEAVLSIDGAMCHSNPDSYYSSESVYFSNITVLGWKSPLHFTGAIPSACDIDGDIQFGLKKAYFEQCKAYRGGALQIEANVGLEQEFYFDGVVFDQCRAIGGGSIYSATPIFVKGFSTGSPRPDLYSSLDDMTNVSSYPLVISRSTATSGGGIIIEASQAYIRNVSSELLPTSKIMREFLDIESSSLPDEDLAYKYSPLSSFILSDCTADYGDDINTDPVHMCYSINEITYCPSVSSTFVEAVSSKAWDAALSVTDEYDQDEYYSSTAMLFIEQLQEDTGIDLDDIDDGTTLEGDWLESALEGSDEATEVFTDTTNEECYSDPYGNAEECACSIDSYIDTEQCGVDYSDFDSLSNVVIKEAVENPCDTDAFSTECLCYNNPWASECSDEEDDTYRIQTFYSCFYESLNIDSCCEEMDYAASPCCYVMDDAASVDLCVTFFASSEPVSIGFAECMATPEEGGIAETTDDSEALSKCCFLFGVENDDQCSDSFADDDYISMSLLNLMSSPSYVNGSVTIDDLLDVLCGEDTRGENSSVCGALIRAENPYPSLYEMCIYTIEDPKTCCFFSYGTSGELPAPECALYSLMTRYESNGTLSGSSLRSECSLVMDDVTITDTVCDILNSGEDSAFETSTEVCLDSYSTEYCCSSSIAMVDVPFNELSAKCRSYQFFTLQMEAETNGGVSKKFSICTDIQKTDTLADPTNVSDSYSACMSVETSRIECVSWVATEYINQCPEYYSSVADLAYNYGTGSVSSKSTPIYTPPINQKSSDSAIISTQNAGISVDSYSASMTLSLYSFFVKPTISLKEDGSFITLATTSSDDTYTKAVVTPTFFRFVSSFSSSSHSQTQEVVIAGPKENTHGYAFIKEYGSDVNAYKLSLTLPTCHSDYALQVPGSNVFRGMCIKCNGPSTYKAVESKGAVCLTCPDGATCHGGGIVGSDAGYWIMLEEDTGELSATNDGSMLIHQCPIEETCSGTESVLEMNGYTMTPALVDGGCFDGHNGTLCLSCNDGWIRGHVNDKCSKCGKISLIILTFGGILLAQILFLAFGCTQTAKEQKHKEMLLEYQDLNREVQATIQRRVRSESVHSDLREEGEARQGEDSVQVQLVDQDNVLLHNTTSS
ncbi:Protein of unknown function DUF92, TMEM19 like protein, partial [Aduncisulcus paluster]